MAVTLNTSRWENEYKGLSRDDKPETAPVNSLFLELDTGKIYYFDGSSWYEVGGGGASGAGGK